jgi:flagellar biosynthesis/type III secretory pathway M-ring protein FliF/YscJ
MEKTIDIFCSVLSKLASSRKFKVLVVIVGVLAVAVVVAFWMWCKTAVLKPF